VRCDYESEIQESKVENPMLVTLQYGPYAGQTRHVERNQITQLLLDLRLIELVETPAPPVQTAPHFYVAASATTAEIGLYVQLPSGEQRSIFNNAARPQAEAALGAGPIPDAVWNHFETKRKKNFPSPHLIDVAASQIARNRHRE
jgi:hypothetical protein